VRTLEVYEVKEVYSQYQANNLLRGGGWTVLHVYTRPSPLPMFRSDEVEVVYVLGRVAASRWGQLAAV